MAQIISWYVITNLILKRSILYSGLLLFCMMWTEVVTFIMSLAIYKYQDIKCLCLEFLPIQKLYEMYIYVLV